MVSIVGGPVGASQSGRAVSQYRILSGQADTVAEIFRDFPEMGLTMASALDRMHRLLGRRFGSFAGDA